MKLRQHRNEPFTPSDLVELKKRNIETECRGLIEFVESTHTLDDVQGCEPVKQWLRQDIALWRIGEAGALPKGYLLSGPVGTGKSYLVECLAGEAGVPVVKLKNFRDRWVGSTEGNLERIFRLLRALGRCYVFVDEADQSLGRRDVGGDSGVSGRIYSMLAEEMGSSRTRGRIIWILASSRPDLIEVDFKRPGRMDVKIPLLPAANAAQTYELIRFACRARGVPLPQDCPADVSAHLPRLLTPGAAENIAVKSFRFVKTQSAPPEQALRRVLEGYQPPVPEHILQQQIDLAIAESSDPVIRSRRVSMSARQIDEALLLWRDRLNAAAQNLIDLQAHPVYKRISDPDAQLTGDTAEKSALAVRTLSWLLQYFDSLQGVISRAEELRDTMPSIFGAEERGREIASLLNGRSVQLPAVQIPFGQRSLLGGIQDVSSVSPAELLRVMESAFEQCKQIVLQLDAAWESLGKSIEDATHRLTALREVSDHLDPEDRSALALAGEKLRRLQQSATQDPLGTASQFITGVTTTLDRISGKLDERRRVQAQVRAELSSAQELLESLRTQHRAGGRRVC